MKLATVILAAGKGKRMNDPNKSKVMFTLAGRPMIEYVVQLALDIDSEKIVIIVGHQRESVMDFIRTRFAYEMDRIDFAIQEEQLGTWHALMHAQSALSGFDGNILILSGDVPLLQTETIRKWTNIHEEKQWTASLLSGIPDDPFGYGRILRDTDGAFYSIREEKDANESEKAIQEINSWIYFIDARRLFSALSTIKTDNAQGEYYLTDIFDHFISDGISIWAFQATETTEILWVNTVEQLEWLEKELLER